MTCEDTRIALVGDDALARVRAERHAEGCAACAEVVAGDRRLAAAVEAWKGRTPAPPETLERRILDRVSRRSAVAASAEPRPRRRALRWAAALPLAAAAVLVLVLALPRPSPVERAVQDLEALQESYVEALARLESAAVPVLERAADPELDPREAALLLSYRDRLRHLDAVIAEVETFLDDEPGHAGGHKVLLAAYREKDELLRQILDRTQGAKS